MTQSTRSTPRAAGAAPTGTALISTVATVAGPFTVVAVPETDGEPTVLASGWTDSADELVALIAPNLRPQSLSHARTIDGITDRVLAYHAGDVHVIDDVPVRQRSGEFLEHAWEVLRRVEAGHPVTYTEFARRSGRPRAARAAGSACSRNAAALFVPCHRVVPVGGGVGHFRWGSPVKQWLLDHESAAG